MSSYVVVDDPKIIATHDRDMDEHLQYPIIILKNGLIASAQDGTHQISLIDPSNPEKNIKKIITPHFNTISSIVETDNGHLISADLDGVICRWKHTCLGWECIKEKQLPFGIITMKLSCYQTIFMKTIHRYDNIVSFVVIDSKSYRILKDMHSIGAGIDFTMTLPLSLSPDRKKIVVRIGDICDLSRLILHQLDISDIQDTPKQLLKGHTRMITAVNTFYDGKIISSSYDMTLRIWDPDTLQCIKIIRFPLTRMPISLTTLGNTHLIAIGLYYGDIMIIDTDTSKDELEPLALFTNADRPVGFIQYLSRDHKLLTYDEDHKTKLWQIPECLDNYFFPDEYIPKGQMN